MVRVETSVVVDRPVEELFEVVTDVETYSLWMPGCLGAKQTSEGPMGVGTTYTDGGQFLGRRVEETLVVTTHESNRKFGVKTTSVPMRGEGAYTFEPVEGGTKVTLVGEVELGGFFKLAKPIVERAIKRQGEGNLAGLKDLLEAQAEVSA